MSDDEMRQLPEKPQYNVLDGGSLLHRVVWKKGETFGEIAEKYVDYVTRNFNNPIVVFDGYSGPSIKDATHHRRAKGANSLKVIFTANTPLKSKKELFLANSENKQNFLMLLDEKLRTTGVQTLNADGDADVLIAQTGVDYATSGITYVTGEDTDILVLLCHHVEPETEGPYFKSEKSKSRHQLWNILLLREKLGEQVCRHLPFIHAICSREPVIPLRGCMESGKAPP